MIFARSLCRWRHGSTLRAEKLVCVTLAFLERTSRTKRQESERKKRKEKETLRNGKGRSCHIPDFPVYLDVTKRALRANPPRVSRGGGEEERSGGGKGGPEGGRVSQVRRRKPGLTTYVRAYVLVTFRDTRFELSGCCPRAILHAAPRGQVSTNNSDLASTSRERPDPFPRENRRE